MLQVVELETPTADTLSPARASSTDRAAELDEIYVVFTSTDETLAALRVAARLARSLDSVVRLVDFRVVPTGAPVEAPTGRSPVETEAFLDRVRDDGIDARAHVYVCRDVSSAIPRVFKPRSMILVGGRHHWWPTRAERLRQMLERHGHFVLLVDGAVRRE